jgi:hypothetical protein
MYLWFYFFSREINLLFLTKEIEIFLGIYILFKNVNLIHLTNFNFFVEFHQIFNMKKK